MGDEICGVSVTVKKDVTSLCVWNRNSSLHRTVDEIEYRIH